MLADEDAADTYHKGPEENTGGIAPVFQFRVIPESEQRCCRKSECVGRVRRKEAVKSAFAFKYSESAAYHGFIVAWTKPVHSFFY